MKVTDSDCAALSELTAQVDEVPGAPLPLHAPEKVTREPEAAAMVSVTLLLASKVELQDVPGQLMPAGLEVTVPLPFPETVTVTG